MQARAAERSVEVVNLGRRLDLHIERRSEQWRPWHELAVDGREPLREDDAIVLAAAIESDSEQGAKERPERVIGGRRFVLLAAERDLLHVRAVVAQLLGQARLADAGLADQLDHRPEAHAHRLDGCAEHGALALSVDEREPLLAAGLLIRLDQELTEHNGLL